MYCLYQVEYLQLKHDIVHLEEVGDYLRKTIKHNSDKGLLRKK